MSNCVSNDVTTIDDFKKSFSIVKITNIPGKFQVRTYEEFGDAIFDFNSEYKHSITYISPFSGLTDTIIIDNQKFPLDSSNCLFYDSNYSSICLNVLDAMSIYEFSDSINDYMVFESVFAGATGKGINTRVFVIFIMKDNKIVNTTILSSWFGDSNNFVKSKSQGIEFLKFEPIFDESSIDTNVYGVKVIDLKKLEDSGFQYKVIETYDCKKNEYNYKFEQVENF